MKSKSYLVFITIALIFTACKENKSYDCSTNPEFIKKEHNLAEAPKINGLIVFIKSQPLFTEYSVLGQLKNDADSQVQNATKDKKFLQGLKGLVKVSNNNMDFNKLLSHMTELAKMQYGDTAEALIFEDNLSVCTVIKFNK